jgi:hypothetical protein
VLTPGSARTDEILPIAFEKPLKNPCTDVLILVKFGPLDVDKDDNPGPVYIRGNDVDINLVNVEKLDPSIVDIVCIVE